MVGGFSKVENLTNCQILIGDFANAKCSNEHIKSISRTVG
jgi:hypothetical protein